jgi:HSP20 family protein
MTKIELAKPTQQQPVPRQFGMFEEIRDEMNRVLERFESGWPRWTSLAPLRWPTSLVVPDLDVHENDKSFTIEVELPGVEEKDVTVSVNNGYLTVKGEKKTEREVNKDNYHLAERSFGSFERSLRLPDSLDDSKIEANFTKGILKITAPKRADAKAERKIAIKS